MTYRVGGEPYSPKYVEQVFPEVLMQVTHNPVPIGPETADVPAQSIRVITTSCDTG
jgi:hypothetical protein